MYIYPDSFAIEANFIVTRHGERVALRLSQLTRHEFHRTCADLEILAVAYDGQYRKSRDWTVRRLSKESAAWLRSASVCLIDLPLGAHDMNVPGACKVSGELDLEHLFFITDRKSERVAIRIWELDDAERDSYQADCRIIAEAFRSEAEAIGAYTQHKFGNSVG